jgi:hypothetical protein
MAQDRERGRGRGSTSLGLLAGKTRTAVGLRTFHFSSGPHVCRGWYFKIRVFAQTGCAENDWKTGQNKIKKILNTVIARRVLSLQSPNTWSGCRKKHSNVAANWKMSSSLMESSVRGKWAPRTRQLHKVWQRESWHSIVCAVNVSDQFVGSFTGRCTPHGCRH